MEPVRIVDNEGNLAQKQSVVLGHRKLPDIATIAKAAMEADERRGPYGEALRGMQVTPDGEIRHKITLEDIKNSIIENPAKTALAIGGTGAAILGAPVSIPTAAVLGMAAEGIDKTRPFSPAGTSDYVTKTPADNILDIGTVGTGSMIADLGVTHAMSGAARLSRLGDRALEYAAGRTAPLIIAKKVVPEALDDIVPATWQFNGMHLDHPAIDASKVGGANGYPIMDYSRIEGAHAIEKELADEGTPRFVKASSLDNAGAEKFGDLMVGNPKYMHDPRTPEGKIYAERIANRDPALNKFGNAFSGVSSSSYDPYSVVPPTVFPGKSGAMRIGGDYYNTKFSFLSDLRGKADYKGYRQALGYAMPMKGSDAKEILLGKVASGEISSSSVPGGFASLEDFTSRLKKTKNPFDMTDVSVTGLARSLPENDPIVQEFIPLHNKVKIYDKKGKPWFEPDVGDEDIHHFIDKDGGEWAYQKAQFHKAIPEHDAVLYKESSDIGGAHRKGKSLKPGDVLASFDPRRMKYPFNYGFLDINDVRPLAAIPLGALGASALIGAEERK